MPRILHGCGKRKTVVRVCLDPLCSGMQPYAGKHVTRRLVRAFTPQPNAQPKSDVPPELFLLLPRGSQGRRVIPRACLWCRAPQRHDRVRSTAAGLVRGVCRNGPCHKTSRRARAKRSKMHQWPCTSIVEMLRLCTEAPCQWHFSIHF